MMMNRRAFSAALVAGATASLISTPGLAATSAPVAARNVVLVHGLFADGSSWSEVIARLQVAGLNVTSVQNPLTTLPDAVASAQRALALQDGPTVLVAHSWGGTVISEAGTDPKVSDDRRSRSRARTADQPGRGRQQASAQKQIAAADSTSVFGYCSF